MKRPLAPEALYHSGHYDDHHRNDSGLPRHIPSNNRALALLREIERQRSEPARKDAWSPADRPNVHDPMYQIYLHGDQ